MSISISISTSNQHQYQHQINININIINFNFNFPQYITPKSEHEKARISEAIKAGFLFQHVTSQNRDLLYSVMEKVKVKKGDWVIRQGDEGDKYFIVDNGRFEVRILEEGVAPNSKNQGGKVVHVYESGAQGAHPSFGELALMYSTPRAASIIAQTDGQLWALHRNVFRKVLMRRSGRKELMSTLRKVEVLQSLRIEQIQQLADCMTEVSYEKGEVSGKRREEKKRREEEKRRREEEKRREEKKRREEHHEKIEMI